MKKRILLLSAVFAASASFAQVTSLKSKKGFEILPEAGDYAIQFDAVPLLNFGLNAVKIGANTAANATGLATYTSGFNQTFVGKYFTSASEAYRVKVAINHMATKTDAFGGTIGEDDYLTTTKTKVQNVTLGLGKEWRRGHNRLQGFYGAEAFITIGSTTPVTTFEYSHDIQTYSDSLGTGTGVADSRNLGLTKSFSFGIGARGFAGVEYFVLPKISLGAEFGWGIGFNRTSAKSSVENIDASNNVEEVETFAAKNSAFVVGVDNGGVSPIFGGTAQVNVTFHF